MDSNWGVWSPQDRAAQAASVSEGALAPERVTELLAWMASAPPEVVLNEVTVTPLHEQGWP